VPGFFQALFFFLARSARWNGGGRGLETWWLVVYSTCPPHPWSVSQSVRMEWNGSSLGVFGRVLVIRGFLCSVGGLGRFLFGMVLYMSVLMPVTSRMWWPLDQESSVPFPAGWFQHIDGDTAQESFHKRSNVLLG
jgi:hypothetical protein